MEQVQSWEHICGLTRATIVRSGPELAIRNMDWQRHRPIVDAIEAGDSAKARDVVVAHMRETAQRIVSLLAA